MDRPTLLDHRPHWTSEPDPVLRDLARLTPDEQTLFDELRWRRLADGAVRLEQERIDFGRVESAARACLASE